MFGSSSCSEKEQLPSPCHPFQLMQCFLVLFFQPDEPLLSRHKTPNFHFITDRKKTSLKRS